MYRSRPRGKLDKDVLKFLSSMHEDDLLLYYDIIGSQAHVIMLHEIGYLKKSESKKILKVLDEIGKHSGVLHSGNEEFEDIHESVEAYLIGQVGIEIGGKMHTARSRNDQVVVDTRMKVRDA